MDEIDIGFINFVEIGSRWKSVSTGVSSHVGTGIGGSVSTDVDGGINRRVDGSINSGVGLSEGSISTSVRFQSK